MKIAVLKVQEQIPNKSQSFRMWNRDVLLSLHDILSTNIYRVRTTDAKYISLAYGESQQGLSLYNSESIYNIKSGLGGLWLFYSIFDWNLMYEIKNSSHVPSIVICKVRFPLLNTV